MMKMEKIDDFYLLASNEFDRSKDEALWAKLITLHKGDEKAAKSYYIKQRAEEILSEKKKELEQIERFTINSFDLRYLPIDVYMSLTNSTEKSVIASVNSGELDGIIKENSWFIARDSIELIGTEWDYSGVTSTDVFLEATAYSNFTSTPIEKVIRKIEKKQIKGIKFNGEYIVSECALPQLPSKGVAGILKSLFRK